METLIVKVKESEQLDYVLSLLRGLPYVEVERQGAASPKVIERVPMSEAERASAEADFWAMAGMWKDRDIDANELRQRAWKRGNSGS